MRRSELLHVEDFSRRCATSVVWFAVPTRFTFFCCANARRLRRLHHSASLFVFCATSESDASRNDEERSARENA